MTYNVILTYADGHRTMHTFASYYDAEVFVDAIPILQRAGELLDIARAIIERGVTHAN